MRHDTPRKKTKRTTDFADRVIAQWWMPKTSSDQKFPPAWLLVQTSWRKYHVRTSEVWKVEAAQNGQKVPKCTQGGPIAEAAYFF